MTYCNRSLAGWRWFRGLAVVLVLAGLGTTAWADPAPPGPRERQIAKLVTFFLARDHLTQHKLDAEMSRRALSIYLKALDPTKLYFYKSDVEAFRAKQDVLDDLAKQGDVSFGHDVFRVFLQRVDERLATAEKLLAMQHDFTVEEEAIKDRDAVDYPATEAEAIDRWRKKVKLDLLVLKADKKLEGPAAVEKLQKRYRSFAKRMHQTDSMELLEVYLTSITSAFDPHSTYMAPDTVDNFDIDMKLELRGGIGASLQAEDGATVVKELIVGAPAEKDGRLKIGDTIVGVGQGPEGPIEDVEEMKLSHVVKLIRGEPGTVVRLEVIPAGGGPRKIIDLKRERVQLKGREAHGEVFEAGTRPDGKPFRIGVIDLPSFYMDMTGARMGIPEFRSTTRDVRRILEDFNRQAVDAVVLDLRRNGGGALPEAINLTGLFIDQGPVVQVKDADGRVIPYNDLESGAVWRGPLVVLVSKFSASASEILAGAIQDYNRGLIVGDHSTHGKGTVQSMMELGQQLFQIPNAPDLGSLKITIQQFYRPSGESTQARGVLSDIELPSLTTHLDVAEADLDYHLPFDRVKAADFRPAADVDPAIREALRRRSAERCQASPDFQKVSRDVARYLAHKRRKSMTLREDKFLEEIQALNAEKDEQEKVEPRSRSSETTIQRDYYLNEALAITVDYLQMKLLARSR